MKIHSPSPHKQVPSKCNDYFFNYFTLGVVRKLALSCVSVHLYAFTIVVVVLAQSILIRLNSV